MIPAVRPHAPSAVPRRAFAALSVSAALAAAGCGPTSSGTRPAGPSAQTRSAQVAARVVAAAQPARSALLAPGSTAARIRRRGTMIIGGTVSTPMFSLLDIGTGEPEGLDATLSRLLAKYVAGNPDFELTTVVPGTREAVLQDGSVDAVIATYTMTRARARLVDFAGPYFADGLAIEVRRGTTGIRTLADLAGRRVVTQLGSSMVDALKTAAPSARVDLMATNALCLDRLQSGEADAYVHDQSVLAGNAMADSGLTVLPGVYTQEFYGIGLPKGDREFTALVTAWLRGIEADGTWAALWKATVGSQVPGPVPAPPRIGAV
jgi:glutamate transport system substrate-binding protein